MNTISAKIIENTWKKIGSMSPLSATQLINKMSEDQPVIITYLMAVGEDMLNQDEKELLLYLGVVVWKIMSEEKMTLSSVTEETLDTVDDSNMKMLQYLEGETEFDFIETVGTIFKNYNQPEVMRHVVEALMEDTEDYTIRDEMKGVMLIYLKTVIDCFDK